MAITFGTETVFKYREKLKLDKKDKKILYELYKNARTPVSVISKKVALSKDTVKYRIKRMEKLGLILGYTAVINLNRLGHHWNILLLQTKFETSEQETKFINFLQSSKNILKIMKCSSKWDYHIDVVYTSLLELNTLIKKIKELVLLLDFSVLNCLKEIKYSHLPQIFFKDIEEEVAYPIVGRIDESKEKLECDKTDLKLIKALVKNSRTTLLELSRIIRLSPDATTNRIKRLKKNEILYGFMPVINTALLYDEHWIFIQLQDLSPSFFTFLKSHRNIQATYQVGYQYDIFFWITTTTIGEYERILTKIKNKFCNEIVKIDSIIALREYKYTEYPSVEVELVSGK